MAVSALAKQLNDLPEALARALFLRGVRTFDDARLFFRGSRAALHAPGNMAGLDQAVGRVVSAIRSRERVVVYGDYDVDGTTSTAMVTHFLRERGVPATFFIPDRLRHGYGMCNAGVDEALNMGASLLIALDCGVTAHQEVSYANARGLDVVICDHHTPLDTLPTAIAVLNPKRSDCAYPFNELCGCGVAFKLLHAVSEALDEDPGTVDQYLDLVALATAADVVPLRGENRILLREGIGRLRQKPRLGIRTLAEQANVRLSECDTRAIQFGLAPRINAAGRLGDAKRAVRLLLTDDETEALARARQLERINADRRALDKQVLETARQRAEAWLDAGHESIVLHDDSWHLGVLGIVAARLVDRLHRPAVLLGSVNGVAKGSARSIDSVNVYQALNACADLLQSFGGHDYAAGLALAPADVHAFAERFDQAVRQATTVGSFTKRLDVDAEVDVNAIDHRFWAVLEQFAPFGAENAPPVFVSRGLRVAGPPRCLGKNSNHLKFRVAQGDSASREVIGFGLADRYEVVADAVSQRSPVDIAYEVTENVWNGVRSLQLNLRDVRPG
ncbi:MAG: single-stranded-DNA-specific exonuclease RecJ [Rhodothermales bacterium]|nr:single-stranded-DNA-specific exonuclease RecJ [Rhodothermales bacterium]